MEKHYFNLGIWNVEKLSATEYRFFFNERTGFVIRDTDLSMLLSAVAAVSLASEGKGMQEAGKIVKEVFEP